jgi:hypothetical protein
MRQFVGEQSPAVSRFGRIPPGTEYNIVSHGVRMSVQVPRRSLGHTSGMHPYPAKIMAEARLEEGFRDSIEGLPR